MDNVTTTGDCGHAHNTGKEPSLSTSNSVIGKRILFNETIIGLVRFKGSHGKFRKIHYCPHLVICTNKEEYFTVFLSHILLIKLGDNRAMNSLNMWSALEA